MKPLTPALLLMCGALAACHHAKPAQQTRQSTFTPQVRACLSQFTVSAGIKDAHRAKIENRVHLLTASSYGETISNEVPGLGGQIPPGSSDRSFYVPVGPMEILMGESDGDRSCTAARWDYAAAYNEETVRLSPKPVLTKLLESKVCRFRRQDLDYIAKYRAVSPSAHYESFCGL
jgi:hypothetical protein